MNEDQFNKFFRKKLLKYPSQVPEDMWQRIQGKKKRRFLFWWLFFGVLCISFGAGYLLMQKNSGNNTNRNAPSFASQKTEALNNNTDTGSMSTAEKSLLPQSGVEKKNINETGAKNTSAAPVAAIPGNVTKNTYVKDKQHTNNSEQHIYDKGHKYSYNKKSKLAQKQKLYITTATTAMQNYPTNETDSSITDDKVNQKNNNSNDTTAKVPAAKAIPLAKDSSKKNVAKKDTSAQNKKQVKKAGIFLTASFSPGVPINTFKSDNVFYTVDFLKSRYKMKLSYTAGVSAGKTLGKGFSIQTGLQYSQINMMLKIFDSSHLYKKGRYSNINIPLIVGYDIGHGSFTTTVHTGIMYNISASGKGSILYDSIGNTINNYKNTTGISLYFGMGFTKRLNKKINLFAESYFMYRPSYITKPEIPFKQQISLAGISFGLKYDF